jgi:DNA-binding MarR family transcriptional regulator
MTTYHCDRLEAAGLILRERHGQSVWVSRSARGAELVDLLGS